MIWYYHVISSSYQEWHFAQDFANQTVNCPTQPFKSHSAVGLLSSRTFPVGPIFQYRLKRICMARISSRRSCLFYAWYIYRLPKLGEIPKAVHRSNDSNSTRTMDDLGVEKIWKNGVPVISHGFLEFLKWQEQLESVAKALLASRGQGVPLWVQWWFALKLVVHTRPKRCAKGWVKNRGFPWIVMVNIS